jgi:glutamate carboxypeptidase
VRAPDRQEARRDPSFEIGKQLKVTDTVAGGGTDAAFAAVGNMKPVIERFGLLSYSAHSNYNEYVHIDSIEPRLYLATRLIIDVAQGRVN